MSFLNIGKKIFLISIILFFTFSNTFGDCNLNFLRGGKSKLEKAPICSNSPDFIDKYFSDNISILNEISGTTSSSKGIKALGSKALQTTLGSVGISIMFGVNGFGDFFQNFLILGEDQNVVRDWTKIINFKQYITKKTLLASKKGILLENIPGDIINKINSSNSFIIRPNNIVTNKDLFSYLWYNQLAFEKIYYDRIIFGTGDIKKGIKENLNKDVYTTHFNFILSKIEQNYFEGSDKIECNTPWFDFVDAMENITCNLGGNKLSKASKRFSCNYKRLGYVLGLGDKDEECSNYGNVKLVETGLDLKDRLKLNVSIEGVGKIIGSDSKDNLSKLGNNIKNGIVSTWNGMKKIGNIILHPIDNISKKYKILTGDKTIIDNNYFNEQINNIKEQIKNDYNESSNIFTTKEPGKATNGITTQFPKISFKIYNIIKRIDDEDNGIYKNLVKACENQSPFDGDCEY